MNTRSGVRKTLVVHNFSKGIFGLQPIPTPFFDFGKMMMNAGNRTSFSSAIYCSLFSIMEHLNEIDRPKLSGDYLGEQINKIAFKTEVYCLAGLYDLSFAAIGSTCS